MNFARSGHRIAVAVDSLNNETVDLVLTGGPDVMVTVSSAGLKHTCFDVDSGSICGVAVAGMHSHGGDKIDAVASGALSFRH